MKLILINGQPGTGKTSVANILKNELSNSAYIEADSLVAVNPFEFHKLGELLLKNAVSLIDNFREASYETIIMAGVTRNQELLDKFLTKIGGETKIIFVWLRAKREIRMNRKKDRARDGVDSPEFFEFLEKIYPDIEHFELKNGKYIDIDTTLKTTQEIVDEIKLGI